MEPIIFESKSNSDHRGTVSFTNDLNLNKVVRTYKVINKQARTVRAWHGHKIEEKWISVEDGEFLVCAVKVEDFENPKITYEEKTYLINSVNSFIKKEIVDNDIVWTYSGVRPLIEDNNHKASRVSRDYAFEIDDKNGAPILTVFGGKLTTYRKLSEKVLKKLSKYIVVSNKTWTSDEVLPGATDINVNSKNIPKKVFKRLIETYGAKVSKLNEYYNEFNAGGDLIFEDFYEFEVKYLIKEEMARTSEDILFRRTKLGINFPKEAKDKLEIILKRHL